MAELAKAIAGIFGGIVFILGGLFIYSVVATYQTGYLFAFWAPIMAPIFIILGVLILILSTLYTIHLIRK